MVLVLQTFVNGLINGSLVALLTLGFGLVVGTSGRFHWAMSTSFMFAALITALISTQNSAAFPIGVLLGLIVAVFFGIAIEIFAYRPLIARATGPVFMSIFLTSLGLVIIAENATTMIVGAGGYYIAGSFQKLQALGIHIGGISFASLDAIYVLIIWILIALVWATLNFTSWGRSIRAVQVNPTMSRVVGINPDTIYVLVFALGSILAGVAGIMTGIRTAVLTSMGDSPMFYAFVAAFVAGTQSGPIRFAVAGLLLGLIASISTIWVSVSWAPVIVFAILFFFIAIRAVLSGFRGGGRLMSTVMASLHRHSSMKE